MRAISSHGNYGIQIRPQYQQGMGDGSIQVTQQPVYAKFDPEGIILEAEVERAEKTFSFRGRTQHIDEATPTEIYPLLSLLDTEAQGWDDDTRELVEAELRRLAQVTPDDFFISETTPVPTPYPAWDTSAKPPFQLVAGLVEMGIPLEDALAYERNWGSKRPEVIEALEETIRDRAGQTETVEA